LGKRTLACNAAILEYIPAELQALVGAALNLSPQFTAHQHTVSDAAARAIELCNEGYDDDEAARIAADKFGVGEDAVFRAAIERKNPDVTVILRFRGVI
jgi:hypothetical protein